jgi:hypothetical protein
MSRRAWTDYLAAKHVQGVLIEPPEQPRRRAKGKTSPARSKLPKPLERDIQKIILEALRLHPKVARIERTNTGSGRFIKKDGTAGRHVSFGFKGQADLTGVAKDGRAIAIEVKRPRTRNNISPEQRAYLDQVREAGGYAGVACSADEAFAILEVGA